MHLVILTTAITRGDFHKKSLGKFYNCFQKQMEQMHISHIINLDCPEKLASTYSKEQSLQLFETIIPKNVELIIIPNENPGFLNAYKNVVNKAKYVQCKDEKVLYWWLEDDWEVIYLNEDFFSIIELFPFSQPYAFNSVQSSPLGSFRGGPIMNALYFQKYFDIVSNNIANDTCDPERQVSRWISGIKRKNGNKMIHRIIENDNTITIVFFYYKDAKIRIDEIPHSYYCRKDKYNENLCFHYYVIQSNDLKTFSFGKVNMKDKELRLEETPLNIIFETLENHGIHYIVIKPYHFADIGRKFNEEHALQKWTTINDKTTYV